MNSFVAHTYTFLPGMKGFSIMFIIPKRHSLRISRQSLYYASKSVSLLICRWIWDKVLNKKTQKNVIIFHPSVLRSPQFRFGTKFRLPVRWQTLLILPSFLAVDSGASILYSLQGHNLQISQCLSPSSRRWRYYTTSDAPLYHILIIM